MKLYTFQIPDDTAEGRLLPLVKRMLPELPEYAVRAAFNKRDVKQNGQRADAKTMLIPGAEVRLYTLEDGGMTLIPILYEDDDLLVVRKPVGVSCERDSKGGRIITELAGEALRRTTPEADDPYLCHRLDNQTDGLLLLAKNEEARQAMESAFAKRQIHKHYTCVVRGTPKPAHQMLRGWLVKDERLAKVRIVSHQGPGAAPIITEYTVLSAGETSRLDIALHTGRTHQIRAHMAAIGHPLLGDDKYGDYAFNKRYKAKRLMLCATSLSFELEGKWRYMNDKLFTIDPDF